jgi:hypothetical protein
VLRQPSATRLSLPTTCARGCTLARSTRRRS